MYLGQIVETGTVSEVFEPPQHPYTELLLSSIPNLDPRVSEERIRLEGQLPDPANPPTGCRFHTRCPYAMPQCETDTPRDLEIGDTTSHTISCHLFDGERMEGNDTDVAEIVEKQEKHTP